MEPPGRGGPAGRFDGRRAGSAARGQSAKIRCRAGTAAGQPPAGAALGAPLGPGEALPDGAGVIAGIGGLLGKPPSTG